MELIDERGRVFGVVNVIDLLVVLFVGAVLVAGAALVLGGGDTPAPRNNTTTDATHTVSLTVRSENVEPYVATAVPASGSAPESNVTAIENKSVEPARIVSTTDSGEVVVNEHPRLQTLELDVTVTARQNGSRLVYRGQDLRIGQPITLDFETVRVGGTITRVQR